MYKKFLLFLVCIPLLVHAKKALVGTPTQQEEGPWLTGPILTPAAHVIPQGHANFEPYLYWSTLKGEYDKHWHYHAMSPRFKSFLSQTLLQFGILPATELDILPQFVYNNCNGKHTWRIADMPFAIAFQLLQEKKETWWPTIKLRVGAVIPIGKHDKLNPKKFITDFGGLGDWAPSLAIIMGKIYHLGGFCYFEWRMNLNYTFTAPIPIHGLSSWGGSPSLPGIKETRGTVYPGCLLVIQQGFEYSITHNWALALDLQYEYMNRTRFSGRSPTVLGVKTKPGAPSAEQFSIAPGIEYNFNANIGIITGPWFSFAGRNDNQSDAFFTWVFAVNIYH